MSEPRFPEQGILWLRWCDETLNAIAARKRPVLVVVADRDPMVSPFLREIFEAMPADARLRALLHESVLPLLIEADGIPVQLEDFGAGTRYHIAILSPYGLTPMATFDPIGRDPERVVDDIVEALDRVNEGWRS
jgi:hypothetical protein